jgi:hypothetical protein
MAMKIRLRSELEYCNLVAGYQCCESTASVVRLEDLLRQ